jgi:hypothetical protein
LTWQIELEFELPSDISVQELPEMIPETEESEKR